MHREFIHVHLGEYRVQMHDARVLGISKASTVSISEASSAKIVAASCSMASGWVRWEMPTPSTRRLRFRISPPSMQKYWSGV